MGLGLGIGVAEGIGVGELGLLITGAGKGVNVGAGIGISVGLEIEATEGIEAIWAAFGLPSPVQRSYPITAGCPLLPDVMSRRHGEKPLLHFA